MMRQFTIVIKTPEELKDLVSKASSFTSLNLSVKTSQRVVDCKSILGLLTLNLSEPITVTISEAKSGLKREEFEQLVMQLENKLKKIVA